MKFLHVIDYDNSQAGRHLHFSQKVIWAWPVTESDEAEFRQLYSDAEIEEVSARYVYSLEWQVVDDFVTEASDDLPRLLEFSESHACSITTSDIPCWCGCGKSMGTERVVRNPYCCILADEPVNAIGSVAITRLIGELTEQDWLWTLSDLLDIAEDEVCPWLVRRLQKACGDIGSIDSDVYEKVYTAFDADDVVDKIIMQEFLDYLELELLYVVPGDRVIILSGLERGRSGVVAWVQDWQVCVRVDADYRRNAIVGLRDVKKDERES